VWPKLAEESFVPPAEMSSTLDSFQRHFEKIKTPRKLLWDLGCGVMKLSLTTEAGQNIAVRVSPLQGCVLMLFGRHNRWSLQQLCKELSLESESLKRKILPLINQGLLQEVSSSFDVPISLQRECVYV